MVGDSPTGSWGYVQSIYSGTNNPPTDKIAEYAYSEDWNAYAEWCMAPIKSGEYWMLSNTVTGVDNRDIYGLLAVCNGVRWGCSRTV